MSRRTRRPLVLSGIETLEQRQMLHGGVASEPKTALLHLVDNGRDADKLATARQHHAAQLTRAAEARAQAHQRHMLVHEQSLHVKAAARDHVEAAHAAVLRVTAAHPAKHVPAKHHKPHAKAKHHAKPITTTPVVPSMDWGKLIGSVVTTATATGGSTATTISKPAITTNPIATPATAPPVSVNPTTPAVQATITTTALTRTLAVGEVLDTKIIPGGIAGQGITYTITPQPLPANMIFDRTTGELTFTPAPGQGGHYQFTVTTNGGLGNSATVLPIDVSAVPLAATTVSGQVVDELGLPLAGMPVAIGNATATTDLLGHFTLSGVAVVPGPISAGGTVADAQDRQGLLTPVVQLLGHELYPQANNVIAQPLILPKINWTTASTYSWTDASHTLNLTNSAVPGFQISIAPNLKGTSSTPGSVQLAQLPASVSAQHLPSGFGGNLFLVKTTGIDVTKPVTISMPNTAGLKPGAITALLAINFATAGKDTIGYMVVSDDGKTMTSTTPVTLRVAKPLAASSGGIQPKANFTSPDEQVPIAPAPGGDSASSGQQYLMCLAEINQTPKGQQNPKCYVCEPTAGGTSSQGNGNPGGSLFENNNTSQTDSDVGLISGDFFQDHQTVTYQSQGQARGIDLQYNSGQAQAHPVIQYQFTTSPASNSTSINSISVQVTLAGVVQGPAATYHVSGLTDGTTYNIPYQVDASQLPTGAYGYSMTVTENFGSGSTVVQPDGSSVSSGPSSVTSVVTGCLNVVNNISDNYGAGWSIGGLQQLSQKAAGKPVLITAGQQGTERYDPYYGSGQTSLQDLSLASSTSTAQILTNDGTGIFAGTATNANGITGTAAGDLNGDGKPDQVIVGLSVFQVLLNNGTGGLSASSTYTLPSGEIAKGVVLGNFTGHANGVLDAAVLMTSSGGSGSYALAVFAGNGNGTFASPVVTSISAGTSSSSAPNSIATGDFNGDGKTDLVFTTDNGQADVLLAGTGGAMNFSSTLPLPSNHSAVGVTTLDYNGDGKTDLVLNVNDSSVTEFGYPFLSLDLLTGNGMGGFGFQVTSTYRTVGQQDYAVQGLVAGKFGGESDGLEVAVPITEGAPGPGYVDVIKLSSAGTWSGGVLNYYGPYSEWR